MIVCYQYNNDGLPYFERPLPYFNGESIRWIKPYHPNDKGRFELVAIWRIKNK